ncbi:unnamed protein product [Protopolystoma xenopodis]|uniref:Uncharacterized protein n=1 Tax=Protopolystoma xenopodis TaxID=117903 RepID=A0A3S5AEF5_9PLAT|nr:unnamed protein product [Protopolystoma xenopodis]
MTSASGKGKRPSCSTSIVSVNVLIVKLIVRVNDSRLILSATNTCSSRFKISSRAVSACYPDMFHCVW